MVEVYSRMDKSQIWQYQTFETLQEIVPFKTLGLQLEVATIYDTLNIK